MTLPPFIQKADKSGLLLASGVDTKGIPADQVGPGGNYVPIVDNALSFIANPGANPQPTTWDDLLEPEYKGKLQYSTPGQAGDGTAVLILLQHLMGKQGALDYLAKLQANNVGPSSSTGKLQPKVSNGELLVANGDVQMNLGVDQGRRLEVQHLHSRRPPTASGPRSRCPTSPASPRARRTPTAPRSSWRSCCPRTCRRRSPPTRSAYRCCDSLIRSPRAVGRTEHARPRCSRASTCGCRTGTRCSASSTPTSPPTRRPPVADVADTGVGAHAAPGAPRHRAATEPATPAITFDRVGVAYGRGKKATHALVDFNLRVAPGETVALLGPSGSGKSTALNALAGFVRPTSGTRPARPAATSPTCRPPSGASVWCCSPTRCSRTCGSPRTSRSG